MKDERIDYLRLKAKLKKDKQAPQFMSSNLKDSQVILVCPYHPKDLNNVISPSVNDQILPKTNNWHQTQPFVH
jgi:hypothetical protein